MRRHKEARNGTDFLHAKRAEEIALRNNWENELGRIWDDLCDLLRQQGRVSEANDLARRTLELGMRLNDRHILTVIAYRFSDFAARERRFDEALSWMEKGMEWAREMPWTRALAWYGYRRGALHIDQGEFAEAEPLLLEAMEKGASWGERRLVAYCKRGLALVYEGTGRLALARQAAAQALGKRLPSLSLPPLRQVAQAASRAREKDLRAATLEEMARRQPYRDPFQPPWVQRAGRYARWVLVALLLGLAGVALSGAGRQPESALLPLLRSQPLGVLALAVFVLAALGGLLGWLREKRPQDALLILKPNRYRRLRPAAFRRCVTG